MVATFRKAFDRLKTEHLGVVDRVIWSDADAQRVIVGLQDGFAAVGQGVEEQFQPNQRIRFLGRWKSSPKYGDQFAFDTFVADVPPSRKGQIDYLIQYAPNVGKATAEKLCDRYGYEAVSTLRERPELVAADRIMSATNAEEAAAELKKHERLERTKIDLFELLKGRGFSGKLVDAAIKKWGAKAPFVIRRNPFALLVADMPGAGFKRCDKMWIELGRPLNALKRQMLCGWNTLRDGMDGHTWYRGEKFVEAIQQNIQGPTDPRKAIILGLRSRWIKRRRDDQNVLWLAETEKADAEQLVADRIRELSAGPSLWPADLPVSTVEGDGLPSQHQHDIAATALSSPVGILAGSPGTGKTHTLAFILRDIIARYGVNAVAVCAPTGKAAVRATQSLARLGLPIKATTIHRRLGIGRNGHDGKGWGFIHTRDNPLPYQFLIVDESSMIDTTLMSSLLDATIQPRELPAQAEEVIEEGKFIPPPCRRCGRRLTDLDSWEIGYGPECRKHVPESEWEGVEPEIATRRVVLPAMPAASLPGTHVLFVGDPHQLPPVGHGAPLRDLMSSGKVACGELSEIRRNAGLIVEACRDIKAGTTFQSAERIDLDAGQNLLVIPASDEAKQMDVLRNVLDAMTRFDKVWETQILVGLNKKGRLSREHVNDTVRLWLNPPPNSTPQFAAGDKVICLRNSRVIPHVTDPGRVQFDLPIEGPRHYLQVDEVEFLANGETGRVLCVDHQFAVVRFREDQPGDELVTKVFLPKTKGNNSDEEATAEAFDLAYAVTVHKCQGSESKCVIILADPSAGQVASREWWYTAISRASRVCIIIGRPDVVYQQCRRESLEKRKTFLVELISDAGQTVTP